MRKLLLGLLLLTSEFALLGGEWPADAAAWRAQRAERLQAAQGWLTLVGLHWLTPEMHTIGTEEGADVRVAAGPKRWGRLVWAADGRVQLRIEAEGVCCGERPIRRGETIELVDDEGGTPTVVQWQGASLTLLRRGEKHALRVKDDAAPSRTQFLGLDYFSYDADWRVEATWHPWDHPQTLRILTVTGGVEEETAVGEIRFSRDGKTHTLVPFWSGRPDEDLFLVFADETSGDETYGSARFLVVAPPRDGRVTLDFNRAYNPPCAFTSFATCPLPPKGNVLPLPVRAGEKRYRGEAAHP